MLRNISSVTIGYLIAGAVLAPVLFIARAHGVGLHVVAAILLFAAGWCCAWRYLTGRWPGDELR